jgi:hypothetical protein
MGEGLLGQREASLVGQHAAVGLQLGEYRFIVLGFGDDADAACLVAMILGRRTNHGRAADINVLDRVDQGAILLRHGLRKWVEVDHHQIDGRDAVLLHGRRVLGVAADAEDAAMHLGMQGLDPAVEHFGEAGVVGDVGDVQSGIAQQFCGAAGGKQLDPELRQSACEIHRAALVGNANERLCDLHRYLSSS